MSCRLTAARWPARSEPANSQLLRPMAIGRIWCSSQLLPGMLGVRTPWRGLPMVEYVPRTGIAAKLCGHHPHAYLRDVPLRLPEHPARSLEELLPHRWEPPTNA